MSGYGFFRPDEIKETRQASKPGVPLSCYSCGLYRNAHTPKMPPWGGNKKKLTIVGDAPNEADDAKGRPWGGNDGTHLQAELRRQGVDLKQDCLSLNSINCRPPDDRAPTGHEIACCRVKIVDPALSSGGSRVIIPLGGSAVDSVIGAHVRGGSSISLWRGWTIPDQKLGAWVCPTFHPSYVEREDDQPQVATIWRQDMRRAIDMLDVPVPSYRDYKKHLTLLHNEDDVEAVLRRILAREEGDLCAFDYETTGLRPQAPGQRIVCVSVATEQASYAFMGPRTDRIAALWKRFLRSPNISKVAQNMKFEDTWSQVLLGTEIRGWAWDPMLAAHVLDNRTNVTGLKFQTYVNFGVAGYDDVISPYLKGREHKNTNSLNRIDDAIRDLGEDVVLEYCAADSLFTRWLAVKQRKELGA